MASGLLAENGLIVLPYISIGFLGLVGLRGPMSLKTELGFTLFSLRSPGFSAKVHNGHRRNTSQVSMVGIALPPGWNSKTHIAQESLRLLAWFDSTAHRLKSTLSRVAQDPN